ncbi:hypothetical protein [Phytoactinopolyspora limicola]|uniref:hypothetical protein n=1 Tax=Phytoactinopolyspora limicola TaxID=2715536 RepID=UPI001FE3B018|nr:hypothetical protein [Phytoactinopolyspora limicola]
MFGLEKVEGDGSGVVGLEQLGALLAQIVALGCVGVSFLFRGGVEPVEFGGDELAERSDCVLGYLDAPKVVLDGGFHVGHEH